MFRRSAKLLILICFASVLIIAGCKKDAKTQWSTELLIPIATSNLSLQNLVKDSSLKTNADNSLTLAFNSSLYSFNLADKLITIPDTSIGQKFTLDSLKLPNQEIFFKMTLGSLAMNMLSSPDPGAQFFGQFILANNGNYSVIPPINGINPGAPFHFDATSMFDSAYLSSGEVQVTAYNHLPTKIDGATFTLRNTVAQSLVASYNMYPVGVNDSTYVVIPVAGAFITNQLDFAVTNLMVHGSDNQQVLIDTNDYFMLKLFITNLHASEAWAKFPSQDVVDITEDVTQEIADRKLTYVDARTGFLHIYITSSVEEQLYLEYTLVGAYDNLGHPLKEYTTVPPAPVGGTVTIDTLIDVAGFAINLTGKNGATFNTYTQRIIAHIDSSGITRHITTQDSLHIRYEITEIAPNYVKGYAGRDTLSAVDSADFTFLNMFKSGTLQLEDVNMNIGVENGIGVDGVVKINSLQAISPINGTRNLTGSIIGQPLVVNRATDFPLTPATSSFTVNNSNSNIKDLLGILPNKLKYNVEVKTNVNGNNGQYRDFAYLESSLKLSLNAEVPLSLIANQLKLVDTIAFDLSNTTTNVNGISDGLINVIVQNKYPIDANLTMVVYDENWIQVDTLVNNTLIASAVLDPSTCKTTQPKKSKIPLYVSEERMTNLKRGRHAVIIAEFSTNTATCNGQYLKIYSDYTLGVTLTARFNYKVNAKL